MTRLGRYTVSTSLLAALLALPCPASAHSEYEEPTQLCHDLAESAYQMRLAMGDAFPDETYDRVQANCEYTAYRAWLIADSGVSLNELIAFDNADQCDTRDKENCE